MIKSIIWIIDGSLKDQLHQNARISPASELAKLGWQVTMVTSGAPDNLKNNPVQIVEVTSPKLYFWGMFIYYIKILKLLFSDKFSGKILFFQLDSMAPILLTVPFWQTLTRKKRYHVVLDYRSMPMDTISLRGKLRSLMFFTGHKIASKLDIHITAITNRIVKTLKIPAQKLICIWPSGANIDNFKNAFETRRWPNEKEPIRLLYIGTIRAERNLIAVIKAARIAKERGVNLTLDIVGSGDQKETLQKLAKNCDNPLIKVWGPLPQSQIPKLLTNYDFGILPFPDVPKMNVSSAIKMFEYMAAGMPIIATKIEAHTRIFKDKDFVFWTDETPKSMADAMAAASASKSELTMLGKNAREYSRPWSWAESTKKLANALDRIILNSKNS
jgi:glycosyltransferase involved in cell wall biosynthesis